MIETPVETLAAYLLLGSAWTLVYTVLVVIVIEELDRLRKP